MAKRFLYYIAEDDVRSYDGKPDEDEHDVYEQFYQEHDMYPLRVLGVTKNDGSGCIEAQVVWEAEDYDES